MSLFISVIQILNHKVRDSKLNDQTEKPVLLETIGSKIACISVGVITLILSNLIN